MRRRQLEVIRALSIDEGLVCPVALQGDRADPSDIATRETIAIAAVS